MNKIISLSQTSKLPLVFAVSLLSASAFAGTTYRDARTVVGEAAGDSIHSISVKSIAGDIEIVESLDGSVSVTPVLYSESQRKMDNFFDDEIATSVQHGNVSVQLGVGSYSYRCSSISTNGVVRVRSRMCINKVIVAIPHDFSGKLRFNGTLVLGTPSVDDLISSIKAESFSSDQVKVIREMGPKLESSLDDDSLLRVMESFNSLGKIDALKALRDAGILRNDYKRRTVSDIVKDIPFSSDKDSALDIFDSL